MALERRGFELRAIDDGGAQLVGVAVPWNTRAGVGRFTEEFRPGALTYEDVLVNVLHDPKRLVARSGGGLTLTESQAALEARIALPDTQEGRDTAVNVASGLYKGLSIEFKAIRDEWAGTHRIVHEALLDAIGIVARPAYAGATLTAGVEMRSEEFLSLRSPETRIDRWRLL